jgi:hypothetical protein
MNISATDMSRKMITTTVPAMLANISQLPVPTGFPASGEGGGGGGGGGWWK